MAVAGCRADLSAAVCYLYSPCIPAGKSIRPSRGLSRSSSNGQLLADLAYNGVWLVQEHSLPDWFFAPPPTCATSSIEC
jgi:hypothetical protein